MTVPQHPRLGVAMFSFTNEWRLGQFSLKELLQQLSQRNIGPGFEIIGTQAIRDYPRLDADSVKSIRHLLDKYQRVPTCLSAGTDVMRRRGRPMSESEIVADLTAQIDVAYRLAFPVVRIQIGLSQPVLEQLVTVAERKKIRLGMEIHAPQGGETPAVQVLRDMYARIGSASLGYIPDFSSTMKQVPAGQLRAFMRAGLSAALTAKLVEAWSRDDLPLHDRFKAFEAIATAEGADRELVQNTQIIFHMFGRQAVDSWRPLMDQVFHVHAKFYELDATDNEPSIPYLQLVQLFRDAQYGGWFSSEWEGHAFALSSEIDAMDLVERHHKLIRHSWSSNN